MYNNTYNDVTESCATRPTTHQILYLCTDPYTVLEHVGQGDGVGKAQPHQSSIEGGGERYG